MRTVLNEAFNLIFRDSLAGFPSGMLNIFNGKVVKALDTSAFLTSKDPEILTLKHMILYSARLAFHLSVDKFIMADFDIPDHRELLVSLDLTH